MVRVSNRHADSDRRYGCVLAAVVAIACALWGTIGAAPALAQDAGTCATIETHDILCQADGSFTWSFTLTNTSGQTATALIFGDPAISPQAVPLAPPLLNGTSVALQFTITGPAPGAHLCFPIILANVQGDVCCHLDFCIDLPDCDCGQVSNVELVPGTTPGTYALSFTFTNLAAWNTGHIVFVPPVGGPAVTFAPPIVNVPRTPPFGSQALGPISVTTAAPAGTLLCFTVGNHSVNWTQCCFIEVCVVVPDDGSSCPPADLNHDGVVDAQDMAILLGAWGNSGLGDLNGDGVVDGQDLAILLGMWGLHC